MTNCGKYVLIVGLTTLGSSAGAAPPAAPEPKACVGVPNAERYVGMFTDPNSLLSVQEIKPAERMSETEPPDDRAGARLTLAARPGVTAEWLQSVAECHLAHNAARGVSLTGGSPLDVPGATVVVSSRGNAFSVDVTSTNSKVAHEVLQRARSLWTAAPRR